MNEPLAPQLLAEWEQMAGEVRECFKSGESKPIIVLFAAAMAAGVPLLVAEIKRLKNKVKEGEKT